MNKWLKAILKVAVLGAIVFFVGRVLYTNWQKLDETHLAIDWRFGPLAVAGFCATMVWSGVIWWGLAGRMGDRGPFIPLLGAYIYSQVGKYFFKVGLVLWRIERAGRFGMKASVCTLATLLENAMYMISGALVGLVAIARVVTELEPRLRTAVWVSTGIVVAVLGMVCHPKVFYGLTNWGLRMAKKPQIPADRKLKMSALVLSIIGFVPCWIFGGVALWASASCLHVVPLSQAWWLPGVFALSVIIGMASLLPGGFGAREAVLIAALTLQFQGDLPRDKAIVLAGAAAILQRLFQVVAELTLAGVGALLTRRKGRVEAEISAEG